MNDGFDFNRYLQCMKTDIKSNSRIYALALGGVLGLQLILHLWVVFNESLNATGNQAFFFNISALDSLFTYYPQLFIIGTVAASTMFGLQATKGGSISLLLIPATQFEKFMAKFTILVPVFFIAYSLGYACVTILQMLFSAMLIGTSVSFSCLYDVFTQNDFILLLCYFELQSVFLLGSALWPKMSFLKTILALVGLSIFYSLVGSAAASIFLDPDYTYNVQFFIDHARAIVYIMAIANTLFNYILAYYRFKESEIIQRW